MYSLPSGEGWSGAKKPNNQATSNQQMNTAVHNKLVSFIWSIADDCLRDVYVFANKKNVVNGDILNRA